MVKFLDRTKYSLKSMKTNDRDMEEYHIATGPSGSSLVTDRPGPNPYTTVREYPFRGHCIDSVNHDIPHGFRPIIITHPRGKIVELPYDTIGSDETLTQYIGRQDNFVKANLKRDSSNKTLKAPSFAVNAAKYGAIPIALAPSCTQSLFLFEACMLITVSTKYALAVALILLDSDQEEIFDVNSTFASSNRHRSILMVSVLGSLTRPQCLVVDLGGFTNNEQVVFEIPSSMPQRRVVVTAFRGLREIASNGTRDARNVAHYDGMAVEENESLCYPKDEKEVYFTDTESVEKLLFQVTVVNSKGDLVCGGHINHGFQAEPSVRTKRLSIQNGSDSQDAEDSQSDVLSDGKWAVPKTTAFTNAKALMKALATYTVSCTRNVQMAHVCPFWVTSSQVYEKEPPRLWCHAPVGGRLLLGGVAPVDSSLDLNSRYTTEAERWGYSLDSEESRSVGLLTGLNWTASNGLANLIWFSRRRTEKHLLPLSGSMSTLQDDFEGEDVETGLFHAREVPRSPSRRNAMES
ncbi:unnamed protein product [Fusarium equiseti]|uniref:Uncharacterized protein n=1 Tax=Fusarium equiseti TaxID=61235 RepID=A0A8J2IZZ4_FUSEQ|nr:unnamed protein product [Fusarium equiseti]